MQAKNRQRSIDFDPEFIAAGRKVTGTVEKLAPEL